MTDEEFRHPRLAALYDALDPDRSDLDAYVALAAELGARRVLDVGCGTGTLALLLAARGCDVVAVDPAAASLAVARGKPGAGAVRWIEGDATAVPGTDRDLVTLTGNTAQAIADPARWAATLRAVAGALRPGGHVVLETRDPAARAWEGWTREATLRTTELPGAGAVTSWVELTGVDGPLVGIRWTWEFAADGAVLTSESTLRFRDRDEVEADLRASGCTVVDVRDAPDRPGRELVVLARRDPDLSPGTGRPGP
jgi:SAM-dependent methyltransferase